MISLDASEREHGLMESVARVLAVQLRLCALAKDRDSGAPRGTTTVDDLTLEQRRDVALYVAREQMGHWERQYELALRRVSAMRNVRSFDITAAQSAVQHTERIFKMLDEQRGKNASLKLKNGELKAELDRQRAVNEEQESANGMLRRANERLMARASELADERARLMVRVGELVDENEQLRASAGPSPKRAREEAAPAPIGDYWLCEEALEPPTEES